VCMLRRVTPPANYGYVHLYQCVLFYLYDSGKPMCIGQRYLSYKPVRERFEILKTLLQKVHAETSSKQMNASECDTTSTASAAELYACALRWLYDTKYYQVDTASPHDSTLDYLLPLAYGGDTEPWWSFVDVHRLAEHHEQLRHAYVMVCRLDHSDAASPPPPQNQFEGVHLCVVVIMYSCSCFGFTTAPTRSTRTQCARCRRGKRCARTTRVYVHPKRCAPADSVG
jgi:hypothetical protein